MADSLWNTVKVQYIVFVPFVHGKLTLKGHSIKKTLECASENISKYFGGREFQLRVVGFNSDTDENVNVVIEFEEVRGRAT